MEWNKFSEKQPLNKIKAHWIWGQIKEVNIKAKNEEDQDVSDLFENTIADAATKRAFLCVLIDDKWYPIIQTCQHYPGHTFIINPTHWMEFNYPEAPGDKLGK